ncbi:MAG TPA: c-type cytochrome [Steroidobacteraceae bacterium]|nr:c-type cytochrome [Steroidobacteraceae bacterium]
MNSRAQTAIHTAFVCALLGSVGAALAAEPAKAPRAADAILNQYCNVCHLTGWNGAPLNGDANEWQSRLAAGFDSLMKNARQGINNMPPMGTCQDCTDTELEAAIRKMLP